MNRELTSLAIYGTARIYGLIDPLTNQLRYIGKTKDRLTTRLSNHLDDDKKNHKTNWIKKLAKKNRKPVIFVIEIVSVTDWKEAERFWIAYFKMVGCRLTNLKYGNGKLNGTNSTSFKKGNLPHNTGKKRSEATRKKISLAQIGRKNPKWTDEQKTRHRVTMARVCNVGPAVKARMAKQGYDYHG